MLALFFFITLLGAAGVYVVKEHQRKDRQRKTYRLFFPSNLEADSVIAWLRSISGQRSRSIAFELHSTPEGFQYILKVPWRDEGIMRQLQAHLPGLRYEEELRPPREVWTFAVELKMTRPGRTLNIYESTATSLVGSARGLNPGEVVMMQLVISPAARTRPPEYKLSQTDAITPRRILSGSEASKDEITDRRAKLTEPTFQAVLRVSSVAATPTRARYLVAGVRDALRATQSHAVKFERRFVSQAKLQQRLDHPATPFVYPMLLNANELSALMAWPVGNPLIPGLPPVMSRVLPASDAVPREGLVIGKSNFPGHERDLAVGWDQALMHMWYGGVTGVGKTEALANNGRQAMEAGHGLIMIETSGNLYEKLLDYVPKERIDDVILLDVADYQHPVGFNLLDQGHPMSVIDQIMELFKYKYDTGIWADEYLYHGLRTLMATPGLAFTDLAALLMPRGEEVPWADGIVRNLTDPELKRWWQRQDNRDRSQQQQRADPVLSRIWQLASRPELRYILGQSTSSFQLDDVLRDNKILLVNFKGVSKESASLAGTLLMNQLWHSIKNVEKTKPTFVIIDEFAETADLPTGMETILAQARKHNVGMILANQNLGQLKPQMREAILANARNKVVLQVNAADASILTREFGKHVEPDDFTHQQAFEAVAQVMTPTGVSTPMTLKTLTPGKWTGNTHQVIAQSRQKYARNLSEVHADMEGRHVTKPSGPRPQIGAL